MESLQPGAVSTRIHLALQQSFWRCSPVTFLFAQGELHLANLDDLAVVSCSPA